MIKLQDITKFFRRAAKSETPGQNMTPELRAKILSDLLVTNTGIMEDLINLNRFVFVEKKLPNSNEYIYKFPNPEKVSKLFRRVIRAELGNILTHVKNMPKASDFVSLAHAAISKFLDRFSPTPEERAAGQFKEGQIVRLFDPLDPASYSTGGHEQDAIKLYNTRTPAIKEAYQTLAETEDPKNYMSMKAPIKSGIPFYELATELAQRLEAKDVRGNPGKELTEIVRFMGEHPGDSQAKQALNSINTSSMVDETGEPVGNPLYHTLFADTMRQHTYAGASKMDKKSVPVGDVIEMATMCILNDPEVKPKLVGNREEPLSMMEIASDPRISDKFYDTIMSDEATFTKFLKLYRDEYKEAVHITKSNSEAQYKSMQRSQLQDDGGTQSDEYISDKLERSQAEGIAAEDETKRINTLTAPEAQPAYQQLSLNMLKYIIVPEIIKQLTVLAGSNKVNQWVASLSQISQQKTLMPEVNKATVSTFKNLLKLTAQVIQNTVAETAKQDLSNILIAVTDNRGFYEIVEIMEEYISDAIMQAYQELPETTPEMGAYVEKTLVQDISAIVAQDAYVVAAPKLIAAYKNTKTQKNVVDMLYNRVLELDTEKKYNTRWKKTQLRNYLEEAYLDYVGQIQTQYGHLSKDK